MNSHGSCHTILLIIIGFTLTIDQTEGGILDWFRSKPIWYNKLEKKPLIETFHPKGLRISIGDFDGLEQFKFHAKINEHIKNRDNGTLAFNLHEPINGRWTFIDKDMEFKEKDLLHYWYYVKVKGEEFWSPKYIKLIENITPYPGDNLQFPELRKSLCPCDGDIEDAELLSSKYQQCNAQEYQEMKDELQTARVQIKVLVETLLLLQKSDKNVPTLILTGKSILFSNPKEDVQNFLQKKLDIDVKVQQAHYTDCGILFEVESLIDVEHILFKAGKKLNSFDDRKVYEPEKAECKSTSKNEYQLYQEFDIEPQH